LRILDDYGDFGEGDDIDISLGLVSGEENTKEGDQT
jgi:hypothetical protein